MLEDVARSKKMTEVPKVVVPTTRPFQRPPKPGSSKAKQDKPKISQMEMFKMELQRYIAKKEFRKNYIRKISEFKKIEKNGKIYDIIWKKLEWIKL